MVSENDVKTALDNALQACVTANNLPAIVLENSSDKTAVGKPWLRPTLLAAANNEISIGITGSTEFHGIYQVDVVYPFGAGADAAMATVDVIANYFKRGRSFSNNGHVVTIMGVPNSIPARIISNFYYKPVEILYSSVQSVA